MSRRNDLIHVAIFVAMLSSGSSVLGGDGPLSLADTTFWVGGDGLVSDSTQWTNGVPDASLNTRIGTGTAEFLSDFQSCVLNIGSSSFSTVGDPLAFLTGTANLNASGVVSVGPASGTGTGTVEAGTGRLDIVGGDITVSPSQVNLNPNNVAPGGVQVGRAGGTGTDTTFMATGELNLTGGSVFASILGVGNASGTGSADGIARGTVRIENGDINLVPFPNGDGSSLTIGTSGGTGSFDGDAVGSLIVEQGSIVASNITVGRTSPIALASGNSDGTLIVNGGDIEMAIFSLGLSLQNGGDAIGRFELSGGSVSGNEFNQGSDGSIFLGISGPSAALDYGRISVAEAEFNGSIEASFTNGYLPQPGDVFDLVVADSIVGDYTLDITGINIGDIPNLLVEQSATRIRISVAVPEPSSLALLAIGGLMLTARRRRAEQNNGSKYR